MFYLCKVHLTIFANNIFRILLIPTIYTGFHNIILSFKYRKCSQFLSINKQWITLADIFVMFFHPSLTWEKSTCHSGICTSPMGSFLENRSQSYILRLNVFWDVSAIGTYDHSDYSGLNYFSVTPQTWSPHSRLDFGNFLLFSFSILCDFDLMLLAHMHPGYLPKDQLFEDSSKLFLN